MFREMRRSRQAVSREECIRLLETERRGVLSVNGDDGYPYGIPMNFYYDPEDGKLYLHGAKAGHRFDSLRACDKVCFTTWNTGEQKEGDWAWTLVSVIAFGRAELVDDPDRKRRQLIRLGMKYYPSPEEWERTLEKHGDRAQLIALTIEHLTGKQVHEK
ncbi:MAG: pyridoxamine 5'-phosphate oxidase family protein [Clostridiales bacterium]|nr:pyridoxamine 5'-phosphate oxidase family protein [Clostridiales bacterium]